MSTGNIKAFIIGSILIVIISSLALSTMKAFESAYIMWLAWFSPAIGSFTTAITAKSKKPTLPMLLSIPSAIIFGTENYIWELLGNGTDFPGLKGSVLLATVELPVALMLCTIGGLVGHFTAQHTMKKVQ